MDIGPEFVEGVASETPEESEAGTDACAVIVSSPGARQVFERKFVPGMAIKRA